VFDFAISPILKTASNHMPDEGGEDAHFVRRGQGFDVVTLD
jgi:hypothetical protein